MTPKTQKFLLYFTSGYGAIWFVTMALAVLSQSHINTGMFGLIGFPIIAGVYAFNQMNNKTTLEKNLEQLQRENELLKELIEAKKYNENKED